METLRGRPKKHELVVSPAQQVELERIARQCRSSRSASFRARIVLACTSGSSNVAVAAKLHTTGFIAYLGRLLCFTPANGIRSTPLALASQLVQKIGQIR